MTEGADESRRGKIRLRVELAIFGVGLAVAILGLGEWSVRAVGFAPWRPEAPTVRIEPGGKLTRPHPVLGYTAIPGSFVATDEQGRTTRFTNLPNTLRVTRPLPSYRDAPARPELWLFGCSFTYGSGLADEETFPWRLQRRLPDVEIVNFGMGGYGTLHSLLQLREALAHGRPELVVLVYAGFHDVRNTNLRIRRKAVVPFSNLGPFSQPHAELDEDGALRVHHEALGYREMPFMRWSALAHAVENAYNALEQRLSDSRAVSEAIVLEMDRLAREKGTRLVVVDIWDGAEMLAFARKHGIATLDISVPRTAEYTLSPMDPHPNANATRVYAERLQRFLEPLL